jgi:hypothetical protein
MSKGSLPQYSHDHENCKQIENKTKTQNKNNEDVFYSHTHKTCSWAVSKHYALIQSSDPLINKKVRSWSFSNLLSWGENSPLRIFYIPRKKWTWACSILGILLPKNPKRVEIGLRLGWQQKVKGAPGHS